MLFYYVTIAYILTMFFIYLENQVQTQFRKPGFPLFFLLGIRGPEKNLTNRLTTRRTDDRIISAARESGGYDRSLKTEWDDQYKYIYIHQKSNVGS